jgi:ABC-2 type transport system ATP-binding protein
MHHGQLIAVDKPDSLREKVGSIVVETLIDNKETHYQFFANREAANTYVKGLPADVKTVIIRESNLEDVFIEQTGEKVVGVQ